MIAATEERELRARLERLEKVVEVQGKALEMYARAIALHSEIERAVVKSQDGFMTIGASHCAEMRLQKVAELLKFKVSRG